MTPDPDSSPPAAGAPAEPLLATPLKDRHEALGARMVPFAGYLMPVQYPEGIMAEHRWTRAHAGLFDVSHMGQAVLSGPDHATTARALEALVPADILGLAPGRQRYSQLLNHDGGTLDDLMVFRPDDASGDGRLGLVVNASRKVDDHAWMAARLPANVKIESLDDRALLALQGPEAEAVLVRLGAPEAAGMAFMTVAPLTVAGIPCVASRSGYTGEDGFELSVPTAAAGSLWDALVADPSVKPIGLGARDSLRLEGGLCLYGHELDETTSPVEAGLVWSIQKRRREEGGFIGAERVLSELAAGPSRRRVGISPSGRAPAREGTPIESADGEPIGTVTSGGFGPTVNAPIAMGYVAAAHAAPGTALNLVVRGKALPATVVPLPFVPNRFRRSPQP